LIKWVIGEEEMVTEEVIMVRALEKDMVIIVSKHEYLF